MERYRWGTTFVSATSEVLEPIDPQVHPSGKATADVFLFENPMDPTTALIIAQFYNLPTSQLDYWKDILFNREGTNVDTMHRTDPGGKYFFFPKYSKKSVAGEKYITSTYWQEQHRDEALYRFNDIQHKAMYKDEFDKPHVSYVEKDLITIAILHRILQEKDLLFLPPEYKLSATRYYNWLKRSTKIQHENTVVQENWDNIIIYKTNMYPHKLISYKKIKYMSHHKEFIAPYYHILLTNTRKPENGIRVIHINDYLTLVLNRGTRSFEVNIIDSKRGRVIKRYNDIKFRDEGRALHDWTPEDTIIVQNIAHSFA